MNLGRWSALYSTTHRYPPVFLEGQCILELAVQIPSIEVAVRLQPCAPADVDDGWEALEKMLERN